MRHFVAGLGLLTIASAAGFAKLIPGDAARGVDVFRNQQCIACHAIRGEGGKSAPDLGLLIGRNYTPSWMAALMWNHAPVMWSVIEKQGVARPQLSEAQAADLFAYFHSIRAFERPGDAGRGKQAFAARHCAECHAISSQTAGGGPPVTSWPALTAPIALAQHMWNHASRMQEAMAKRGIRWPQLTSQELTDILVYLQNLPETRGRAGEFALGAIEIEGELLKAKGCLNCHAGKLALERRLRPGTMGDFAVAMWNHAPRMIAYGRKGGQMPPALEKDEMRQIVASLWYAELYAEPGSPQRGERVFARKNCATCHSDRASGAPDLKSVLAARTSPLRPFSMASVLWQHGPAMQKKMAEKNLAWPRFTRAEMVDLLAYLNGPAFARPAASDSGR